MTRRPVIYYSDMDSPLGPVTIATTERGICFLEYASVNSKCSAMKTKLKKFQMNGEFTEAEEPLEHAKKQLAEYFNGDRECFDLSLDLIGTSFQKLVWSSIGKIPYGSTKSYKEVAAGIGAPKAVRAIGGANNKNPVPIIIPCHRVVGSNGAMVGYGGGLDKKEILLKLEGSLEELTS